MLKDSGFRAIPIKFDKLITGKVLCINYMTNFFVSDFTKLLDILSKYIYKLVKEGQLVHAIQIQ